MRDNTRSVTQMTPDEAYEEAVRRIRDVKNNSGTYLSLAGLSLKRLPDEISSLTTVEKIELDVSDKAFLLDDPAWESQNESEAVELTTDSTVDEKSDDNLDDKEAEPPEVNSLEGIATLPFILKVSRMNGAEPTGIRDLSPLAGLRNLRSLTLGDEVEIEDLWQLKGLINLQELCLRGCRTLLSLDGIHHLSQLQRLDLSFCTGVASLLPLSFLRNLEFLSLSFCLGVRSLEPLAQITSLRRLDLSICGSELQLADIKPILPTLSDLRAITPSITDVPQEVLGDSSEVNVIDKVRAYFTDSEHGIVNDNEVRVLVLGNPRVGKTKTVGRLRNIPFTEIPEGSTHGVRLSDSRLPVRGAEEPCRLSFWDFGGQDIYHGTHSLFLKGAAVFLLLWSRDCENDNEVIDGGAIIRNRRLNYWFDYLRQEARNQRTRNVASPVLGRVDIQFSQQHNAAS